METNTKTKRITINPITRLEGHGKIEIFLDNNGDVENAYLQIPELRGFERFAIGRAVEEMNLITPRICGVCPMAHHMASTKAIDKVFGVEPARTAKLIREAAYSAFYFCDHLLHFYYLAAPDYVMGPSASPAERNILGVIGKVGIEVAGSVIKHRSYGQSFLKVLGGRKCIPQFGLPGGVSRALKEEERLEYIEKAKSSIEFSKFSLQLFEDVVLKNKDYLDLVLSPAYTQPTYYMGTVDKNNKVNFYDGDVRVVDPEGKEYAKFKPEEYLQHIAEHVEPWSHTKFTFLKKIGWKGLVTGKDSSVYRVAPLARLNASDGMATPLAQEQYEKMFKTLGGKPAHNTLATHWARLIEMLYAAEHWLELLEEKEITSTDIRKVPDKVVGEGVGIVEAPRGTLIHHYKTDKNAIMTACNLIVATGNNNAAINISIREAAKGVIKKGKINEGLLNMVEMAFRAYDPCMACATHTLPGQMPMEINIRNKAGDIIQTITQG